MSNLIIQFTQYIEADCEGPFFDIIWTFEKVYSAAASLLLCANKLMQLLNCFLYTGWWMKAYFKEFECEIAFYFCIIMCPLSRSDIKQNGYCNAV